MYVLFLAGNIASGKSTVTKYLIKCGAYKIDLDDVSREVLKVGSLCLKKIADAFGCNILNDDGTLNRQKLANEAFSSQDATVKLEEIEHPAIRELLNEKIEALKAQSNPPEICIVEIPLLSKAGSILRIADGILSITAPKELREKRGIERGMSKEDFLHREQVQDSDEYYIKNSTCVIENIGTEEDLIKKVMEFLSTQNIVLQGDSNE